MIDPRMLMPKKPKGEGMREIARMIMSGQPIKPVNQRVVDAFAPNRPNEFTPAEQRRYDGLGLGNKMLVDDEMQRGAPMWQTLDGAPPLPQDPAVPPLGDGGSPIENEDPRGMFYDIEGRFLDDQAYQVADAGAIAPPEEPAPSSDQLAEMGARVGIDPKALGELDLNTTQARNLGYLLRMMEAEKTIRELGDSDTWMQRALEMIPGQAIESLFMDPEYRQYLLARENFNEAALREATGATINNQEMPMQRRNYFPLPSDDEATREMLRRQREARMMALMAGVGPAAKVIPPFGEAVVPQEQQDLGTLSDEELLRQLGVGQ